MKTVSYKDPYEKWIVSFAIEVEDEEAFVMLEGTKKKIAYCKVRIKSIAQQGLSNESIYESLRVFDRYRNELSDF